MPAIIGSGIAAGAGLIGDYFSGKAASKEAQRQRDWQTTMSNTAHRREVRDLRLAGLNPILSATKGGGGASTPSGAVAQVPDYGSTVRGGIATGLQAAMLRANIDNVHADTASKQAAALLTGKTAANLPSTSMAVTRQQAEINEINERINNIMWSTQDTRLKVQRAGEELRTLMKDQNMLAYLVPNEWDRRQLAKIVEGDLKDIDTGDALNLIMRIFGKK